MRQGQQNNKRMRGRNRKGPNPLTRSYESNGPDVKIRGTALHIAEKYVQLARDAHVSGDRVAAENYLQHAEHYYRILAAAQAQMPQPQPVFRSDDEQDDEDDREFRPNGGAGQPYRQQPQTTYGSGEQPYVNGNGGANGNGRGAQDDEGPIEPTAEEMRFEPREQVAPPRDAQPPQAPREPREPRENREGGGDFRPRRRRPYRDRFNENREGGGEAPQAAAPAPAAAESPASED
jgi:hypothetical protein